MTWAEAIYRIVTEGGGGLLFAVFLLAFLTDFWPQLFNWLDGRRNIEAQRRTKREEGM